MAFMSDRQCLCLFTLNGNINRLSTSVLELIMASVKCEKYLSVLV